MDLGRPILVTDRDAAVVGEGTGGTEGEKEGEKGEEEREGR